jgi:hypothetical protein
MTATGAPADTRMMGIVHDALKRDLTRARGVVAADPAPAERQRAALGAHVVWMMHFLHAHHTGEDEGLWPRVRDRNPAAAALLDSLEADHARISPAADAVETAGAAYAASVEEAVRARLVEALDVLLAVLVPHLDREVAEAMPVVAATLTNDEWDAIEQEFNIKPKSARQLATEGHWLIEEIDPDGYRLVVSKVPAVMRFVLLHGFGPAYRRQAARRWVP